MFDILVPGYAVRVAPEPPLTAVKFADDMAESHVPMDVALILADKLVAEGKFDG